MTRPHPARSALPQGEVECPNCEWLNGPDDLVYIPGRGWCCPNEGCGYADPYWNR